MRPPGDIEQDVGHYPFKNGAILKISKKMDNLEVMDK